MVFVYRVIPLRSFYNAPQFGEALFGRVLRTIPNIPYITIYKTPYINTLRYRSFFPDLRIVLIYFKQFCLIFDQKTYRKSLTNRGICAMGFGDLGDMVV
jgi:hypothetical protein